MARRAREMQITGVQELERMTSQIAPRRARNLARSTVHYIAGQVRREMRRRAPRDEGTLRRAIKSVRRRMRGNQAISDVRIEHGSQAKHNAWHWHFIEFGTLHKSAQPYIRPTVEDMTPRIPAIYRKEFGARLEKQLAKDAMKQGVRQRG